MKQIFRTSDLDVCRDGKTLVTEKLQELIDLAAQARGIALLEKGTYLTAALYLKSHMELQFEEGAVLLGTTDEEQYPVVPTRAAGIEMDWYPGILNCDGQTDVVISGPGMIDGQGEYWWNKYWGEDQKGGMRKEYDAKGLRWACDYDCVRVRNLVVMGSDHVTIRDITSYRSGFWNVHICYSSQIHVDGIKIAVCGKSSPSTDGIDIDSCDHVLVENCETSCNDDSICIKSGRDADGYRVGRPCHHITVQNCKIHAGFGVTIGSEVSGGVHDIFLKQLQYHGTDCGFRIKSSLPRRGYILNVLVEDLQMVNVKYPFHFCLNWNPAYSYCDLPEDYQGEVPESWRKLWEKLPESVPLTQVSDITIRNVEARCEDDYEGISRAFHIEGYAQMPISQIRFEHVKLDCKEFGVINYVKDMEWDQVQVSVSEERNAANDDYDNR